MVDPIQKSVKDLVDAWSFRSTLIFSLSIQTFLMFFAPHRKRTSRKFFLFLIWSAYLLADWSANFAAGQASYSRGDDKKPGDHPENRELLAFWVSFLLLHLGGPDTITTLAVEDNELWLRQFFSLGFQAFATAYVFWQSLPNSLSMPMILVFSSGVIKYTEKIFAIYLASHDKFKESIIRKPFSIHTKLTEAYVAMSMENVPTHITENETEIEMEEYVAVSMENLPTQITETETETEIEMEEYVAMSMENLPSQITETEIEMENLPSQIIKVDEPKKDPKADAAVRPEKLKNLNILLYAYKYFNIFKGLVVDLILTSDERAESKMFFNSLTSEEALKILEVELNLIYDALFTKAEILHNRIGASFRFIALGCLIIALCIFQQKNKDLYGGFEVGLTYALLICGIALDSIALIMFALSDWALVTSRYLTLHRDNNIFPRKFSFFPRNFFLFPLNFLFFHCVEILVYILMPFIDSFLYWFLSFRELKWKEYECSKKMKLPPEKQYRKSHKVLARKLMFRRWSEYIHAHNLIEYCLRKSPKKMHHTKGWIHRSFDWLIEILYIRGIGQAIASCFEAIKETSHQIYKWINDYIHRWCTQHNTVYEYYLRGCIFGIFVFLSLPYYLIKTSMDFFGVQSKLDEVIFTSSDRMTLDLWEHIFTEVKNRSLHADDSKSAMRVSLARGDWTLRDIQVEGEEEERIREKLLSYVMEMDYDESLLVWHIATELLYQTQEGTEDNHSDREFSKILSDYMMYLLMMQPTLMSAVAGIGEIRFEDTCEEAKRFFKRRHLEKGDLKSVSEAVLLEIVPANAKHNDVKGDHINSVLFDGSLLAQELQGLSKDGGEAEMWKVVSKVWVELLSYAAANCDAIEHAAQLCKGGQVISFVWLLMAHFGLGESSRSTRR